MLTSKPLHPVPCPTIAATLTTAANYRQPQLCDLVNKTAQALTVARDGMVTQPSTNHLSEPAARFAKRSVFPLEQVLFDVLQLRTHSFRYRLPVNREPAVTPSNTALVRETKKVKRLWSSLTVLPTSLDRVLAELNQTSLVLVKL